MSGGRSRLEVRGLSHAYGDRRVLAGVDLEVAPGEMVGLLGPNGSGKSTVLSALQGLLRPDAGEVLLDGATLVHAQVGDSSALLGGTIQEEEGEEGGGEVTFEELMEEHSATNVREYERVLNSGPRGKLMRFVYDVPDLIDEGKPPPIFKKVRACCKPA